MAAKKRKPGFHVPPSGPDAGWVSRTDKDAPQPIESIPTPESSPAAASRKPGTIVQPRSTGTYTKRPKVASRQRVEANKMDETNNTGAQTPGTLLVNGVKVLGEVAVVPGASLIVDGEVKSGIFHAAGGLLGLAVLGPVFGPLAWLAVGADSYSRSVSGKTIVNQFKKPKTA